MLKFKKPLKFQWDRGNIEKNWNKHQVTTQEAEEAFLDKHRLILEDKTHTNTENRYILIGQTKLARPLFIVFTTRQTKIRIISARNLKRKKHHIYQEHRRKNEKTT